MRRPAPAFRAFPEPVVEKLSLPRHFASRSSVRLAWRSTDRHVQLTRAALGAALALVALALWGLPPVDLHGPLHRLGIMDLLCGGTRAAYFTVTGRWSMAWFYNPLGPLAVVTTALMLLRAVVGHLTRRWVVVEVTVTRTAWRVLLAAASVVVLALTVRQQLMVDVLR
ncbi:MAG TPA: DUF2752 domain-containing protein [Propionicimonas sp.]